MVFVYHRQKRWSVHRWDLKVKRIEPGAVFSGMLYPRRSDLSPDGRYLLYFALKPPGSSTWPSAFSGLSRAPWLFCLQAWAEAGTWTRGMHFSTRSTETADVAERCPWNIEGTPSLQLWAERRIGFVEAKESPARDPEDVWDEKRRAILYKPRPGGGSEEIRLKLGPFHKGEARIDGYRNEYGLRLSSGREIELSAFGWLDWLDHDHVYGATCDGRVVVCALRKGELVETWAHVFERRPPRRPAPEWARSFHLTG